MIPVRGISIELVLFFPLDAGIIRVYLCIMTARAEGNSSSIQTCNQLCFVRALSRQTQIAISISQGREREWERETGQ